MTLSELRDDILARHEHRRAIPRPYCVECSIDWPCDAVRLASLLTTERVAEGLHVIHSWDAATERSEATALLDAIREVRV